MLLSENTAGLGLLHEIKVHTGLLSARDSCIKTYCLSGLDVINCTHENRAKFIFAGIFYDFYGFLRSTVFTKSRQIRHEEVLRSSRLLE